MLDVPNYGKDARQKPSFLPEEPPRTPPAPDNLPHEEGRTAERFDRGAASSFDRDEGMN
jgi:hypothetical protein